MRLARELISAFVLLIAGYLILVHFGGFAKDVGALGDFATSTAKVLQGR